MPDVVVIGGGIAGLSVGACLAAHVSVTVLEAEPALGYHASGRSAATFEANYGKPPVKALARASQEAFQTGGYLSPRGLMILAHEGEDQAFEADMAELHCAEISIREAHAKVPILRKELRRAAFHADAYDIDTDRMLQDYAQQIRTQGGRIETNTRVTEISSVGEGWQVKGGGQTFSCALLVNASGAWADDIAGLAGLAPIGLCPMRRSMARITAPLDHDTRAWPMFFGPGESWYAKPDAGALIVSSAEEDPLPPQDAWADDMVIAEGLDRYQHYVTPGVTRPLATWAGLRTFAPDRLLVLGPDPRAPGFIWCAGQGGYGFSTAPAASRLTADLALGRTPRLSAQVVNALTAGRLIRETV